MRDSSLPVSPSHTLKLDKLTDRIVAYMAAGWDGSHGNAPGFPSDGSWVVKHEGLLKAL